MVLQQQPCFPRSVPLDAPPDEEASWHRVADADTALVTVAVGTKAMVQCCTLLRSLASTSPGRSIHVITDDTTFFLGEPELCPLSQVIFRVISAEGVVEGTNVTLPAIPRFRLRQVSIQREWRVDEESGREIEAEVLEPETRKRLAIKWLKTQLFRLVPPRVRHALYVDADIVVTRDIRLLIAQLAGQHRHLQPARRFGVALWPDFGNSGMPYHTGALWLDRTRSATVLSQWQSVILAGFQKSDQRCLNETLATRYEEAERDRLLRLLSPSARHFAFLNGTVMAESLDRYTLVHATWYRLTHAEKLGFNRRAYKLFLRDVVGIDADPWLLDLVPTEEQAAARQAQRAKLLATVPVDQQCTQIQTEDGKDFRWCA